MNEQQSSKLQGLLFDLYSTAAHYENSADPDRQEQYRKQAIKTIDAMMAEAPDIAGGLHAAQRLQQAENTIAALRGALAISLPALREICEYQICDDDGDPEEDQGPQILADNAVELLQRMLDLITPSNETDHHENQETAEATASTT